MTNYPMMSYSAMPVPYGANYQPQQFYPAAGYAGAQAPQSGIVWVQGLEGAKAHPVNPGESKLLMDSEGATFYIKSADQSGMPGPLRIFHYREEIQQHSSAGQPSGDYVTRSELPGLIAQAIRDMQNGGADNA